MTRLRLPDVLKGIAILFMIQVHIMELFIDYPGRETVVGKISLFIGGPFTAMVFMIVMGYFVAKNKKSVKTNMWRGVKILMLGFLLNIGLNFNLLMKIKFADWPYNPLEYIFGVDILYLAGLSIIILSFLKSLGNRQAFVAVIFLFVVIFFSEMVNEKLTFPERNYATPFIGGNYSWSYFPLFPWLTYPLAGYFFFFIEEKIKVFISRKRIAPFLFTALLLIPVFFFWEFGFSTTTNLPVYYHHTFEYALWAFALLIVYISLGYMYTTNFKTNMVEKFLAWMGKNITLIYVVQWLIIGNTATAIYQTQPVGMFSVWFAGVLVLTLLIAWMAKMRFSKPVGKLIQ